MAERVPTYQPQAESRPLPTPYDETRVTPESQGAPAGRSLQEFGGLVGDIAQHAKANADASAVLGAIGQAKDALNNRILDPERGYASLKGDDALAGRDKALAAFNKEIDEIGGTLTNDAQRRAFQQHALTIREQGFQHAIHHESMQIEHVALAKFQGAADATERLLQAPQVITSPTDRDQQLSDLLRISTAEALRRYGRNASPEAVQSVVGPVMQKAAVDAMEAAIATQDPELAKNTFGRVGPLLGTHQRFYAGVVEKLVTQKLVSQQAGALMRYAATAVAMPDGDPVARVDDTKFAAATAALDPQMPHYAEIIKAAEAQKETQAKVWNQNVAKVVARVETAGDPNATGEFSLSAPGVRLIDRQWLNQNAEEKLIALRQKDVRAQRQDNLADRQISAGNYNNLLAKMIDPSARKQVFGPQTPEEFKSALLDEEAYPGGFTEQDTKRALQAFATLKRDVGKLEEPVPAAVREILGAAFPNTPIKAKDYVGPLHDALQRFVDSEKLKHNGVAPDQAAVRKYGEQELAKGSVTAAGTPDAWYNLMNVRRIDFQTKPEYGGKQFNPKEGGPAEIRGAPAAPASVQAAAPAPATGPAAHPLPTAIPMRAPSDADLAAIDWLRRNPNSPDAPAVRAKLKAKGLE